MSYVITIFAALIVANSAMAQDATCAKAKNPKHRHVCNCTVSNGGVARERGDGKILWNIRGGHTAAIDACIQKK